MMPPMSAQQEATVAREHTHREAVIVAGGFGSRLLPLTTHRPKHLLEVGGVPFLAHQIGRLAQAGVEHVVLATSYRADLFEPVLGDGSRWGIRLTYVQEQEPLGTGGAIRNVASVLSDDPDGAVVILNGDILSGHRLDRQLDDFETPRDGRQVDVSLHLVEVEDARAFGCVPTDGGREGHRLRREERQPRHPAGQRRLLRLPPPRDRHHPGRRGGLGRARDLPRPGRLRRAGRGLPRERLLARRRYAGGAGRRVARPRARHGAQPRGGR